jgi:thiol-disulfide isomerase/thioredoxin
MHRYIRVILFTAIVIVLPFICAATTVAEPIQPEVSKAPQTGATVVFIHSRDCPICQKVSPIVGDLQKQYKGKVNFVDLDVTDRKDVVQSRKLASSMKLSSFFALYKDSFPCVGIFNSKAKCVKELFGANSKQTYVSSIDAVLKTK